MIDRAIDRYLTPEEPEEIPPGQLTWLVGSVEIDEASIDSDASPTSTTGDTTPEA